MVNRSEGFDIMIINFPFIVDLLMVVELFSFTVRFFIIMILSKPMTGQLLSLIMLSLLKAFYIFMFLVGTFPMVNYF